jgi:hypothetical protein
MNDLRKLINLYSAVITKELMDAFGQPDIAGM